MRSSPSLHLTFASRFAACRPQLSSNVEPVLFRVANGSIKGTEYVSRQIGKRPFNAIFGRAAGNRTLLTVTGGHANGRIA